MDELQLSLRGAGGLSDQLYTQLRAAILDGRLRPGDALPATRALAARLAVSRNTVSHAYARLVAEKPGGMCQYKVKLTDAGDVDAELVGWIRTAYDGAG